MSVNEPQSLMSPDHDGRVVLEVLTAHGDLIVPPGEKATDGWREIDAIITPRSFFNNQMPRDGNTRLPDIKAAPVRAIIDTLLSEPWKFRSFNAGLKIAPSRMDKPDHLSGDKKKQFFTLYFNKDSRCVGVLNGSHTYAAFEEVIRRWRLGEVSNAQMEDICTYARIRITILVDSNFNMADEAFITDTSSALNRATLPARYGAMYKEGVFTTLEQSLAPAQRDRIEWLPNQQTMPGHEGRVIGVSELVLRLILIHGTMRPQSAYTSTKDNVESYLPATYANELPHLQHVLNFESFVASKISTHFDELSKAGGAESFRLLTRLNDPRDNGLGVKSDVEVARSVYYGIVYAVGSVALHKTKAGFISNDFELLWNEVGLPAAIAFMAAFKAFGKGASDFGKHASGYQAAKAAAEKSFPALQEKLMLRASGVSNHLPQQDKLSLGLGPSNSNRNTKIVKSIF